MRNPIQSLLLLLTLGSLVLVSGCSTLADAQRERGLGAKAMYQASFEAMWAAMPQAVDQAGLQFVSANREDGTVLAQRGITAFSYGENVAIFVGKVDEQTSTVEVVSKKALATNVFATDWADPIFDELDKRFKRAVF